MSRKKRVNKSRNKKIIYTVSTVAIAGALGASVTIPLLKHLNKDKEMVSTAQDGYVPIKNANLPIEIEQELSIIGSYAPHKITNNILEKHNLKIDPNKLAQQLINKDKKKSLYIFDIESENSEFTKKAYTYFDLESINFVSTKILTFNKDKLVDQKEIAIQPFLLNSESIARTREIKNSIIDIKAKNLKEKLLNNKNSKLDDILVLPENYQSKLPQDIHEDDFGFRKNNFFNFEMKKIIDPNQPDDNIKFLFTIKDFSNNKKLEEFPIIISGFKSPSQELFNSITGQDVLNEILNDPQNILNLNSKNTIFPSNVIPKLVKKYKLIKNGLETRLSLKFSAGVGKIIWKANVSTDSGFFKTFSGEIDGFKTKAYDKTEIDQANIDIKKIAKNLKTLFLNSNINKDKTLASNIKINDFPPILIGKDGFKAFISNIALDASDNRSLKVDVKIESTNWTENQVKPQIKTFTINGFSTLQEIEKENWIKERKRLKNAVSQYANAWFSWPVDSFLLEENQDLILDNIETTDINNTKRTVSYKIIGNGNQLEVKVKYQSTIFPDIIEEKIIVIKGFKNELDFYQKTLDKYELFLKNKNFNGFKLKSSQLFKNVHISELTKDDFFIFQKNNFSPFVDIKFDYFSTSDNLRTSNNTNNAADDKTEGYLHWTLKSKKYNLTKSGVTKLTGFLSKEQKSKLDSFKKISKQDINNQIIKHFEVTNSIKKSDFAQKSVLDLAKPTASINLKLNNIDVTINIVSWYQNQISGQIEWIANIKSTNPSQFNQLAGTIPGFKKETPTYTNKHAAENLKKAIAFAKGQAHFFDSLSLKDQSSNSTQRAPNSWGSHPQIEEAVYSIRPHNGDNFQTLWGVPFLPQFWDTFLLRTWKNSPYYFSETRSKYSLKNVYDHSLLKLDNAGELNKFAPFNGDNSGLDTTGTKNVHEDIQARILQDKVRIDPIDGEVLLIDVELYSKRFPNIKESYTVRYKGFKDSSVPEGEIESAFHRTFYSMFSKEYSNIGTSLGKWFPSMLNFTDKKSQIFYNKIFSGEAKEIIFWDEFDRLIYIYDKIKSNDSFQQLQDKINIWKDKILKLKINIKDLQLERINFQNDIEELVQKVLYETFATIDVNGNTSLLSANEKELILYSFKELRVINEYFIVFKDKNEEDIEIQFNRHLTDIIKTNQIYWKDLLGHEIPLTNIIDRFKELRNTVLFEKIVWADDMINQKLKTLITLADRNNQFDSIKFNFYINEDSFISDTEVIENIKTRLEDDQLNNNSTLVKQLIRIKKQILPSNFAVKDLIVSDLKLNLGILNNENFDLEIVKIEENDLDSSKANVYIKIYSKAYPSIFRVVMVSINGFASSTDIQLALSEINDDINTLDNIQLEEIKTTLNISSTQFSPGNFFALNFPKPSDSVLTSDPSIKARVTNWSAQGTTIKYEVTLFKGLAKKVFNGTLTGFKQLDSTPKNDSGDILNIDLERDKDWTHRFWELYQQSLTEGLGSISNINFNSINKAEINPFSFDKKINIRNFIKEFLDTDYVKNSIGTNNDLENRVSQIKEIIPVWEIAIDSLIFDKEDNSNNLKLSLIIKSRIESDFIQKITFNLSNLFETYESIFNTLTSIGITAKGIDLTRYSALTNPMVLIEMTDDNAQIIKKILLANIKNSNDDFDQKVLAKYLSHVLYTKFLLLKKDGTDKEVIRHNFLQQLFTSLVTSSNKMTAKISFQDIINNSLYANFRTELSHYNQSEMFSDLKSLAKEIIENNVTDVSTQTNILNDFLTNLKLQISLSKDIDGEETYKFSIYFPDDQPSDPDILVTKITEKEKFTLDDKDKDKLYWKILIEDIVDDFDKWRKELGSTTGTTKIERNTVHNLVLPLKTPFSRKLFKDVIFVMDGNRVQVLNISGFNIFKLLIAEAHYNTDGNIWIFPRSVFNNGKSLVTAQKGSFSYSPQDQIFTNADDVDDIYR